MQIFVLSLMDLLGVSWNAANARNFNPALFARLADGDGFALIQRSRALRRKACCAGRLLVPNVVVNGGPARCQIAH